MMRRMMIAVTGIAASVVIAWAVETGACSSAFAYCDESTRLSFLHSSLTASDVFLPATHLHLSRYDQDGSSQSEREPKATIWFGFSGGSGLGTIPLSYEMFREKSSFEVSLGAVSAGAPEGSGTALSVGIAMNFYPEPGFGAKDYRNLYYGVGAGGVFASGGGASASAWAVGAYAGYRFNFNRFSARLSLGAYFFSTSGTGWDVKGFAFPLLEGGFGFMF